MASVDSEILKELGQIKGSVQASSDATLAQLKMLREDILRLEKRTQDDMVKLEDRMTKRVDEVSDRVDALDERTQETKLSVVRRESLLALGTAGITAAFLELIKRNF